MKIIYELDELSWESCLINKFGGINIQIDNSIILIDKFQLKYLMEDAQACEDTSNLELEE